MRQEWLVTVSRTHAKIFEVREEGLKFVKKYDNPDGAARKREFATDKPGLGRSRYAKTKAPHALNGEKDPLRDVAQTFANSLADHLVTEAQDNMVMHLRIAAEPHMAGALRHAFGGIHKHPPIEWIEKDFDRLPTARLEKVLGLGPQADAGSRKRPRSPTPIPKNKFQILKQRLFDKLLR